MKRRAFVAVGAAATAGTLAGASRLVRPQGDADLVLRGALIVDGTGRPPFEGDVSLVGDRIQDVGRIRARGAEEIDVRGHVVAPGFVDIHSHADLSLLVNPKAESRIRQGITLEVVGQDGTSIGPWSDERLEEMNGRYQRLYGISIDFQDVPAFLDRVDRAQPAVNVASMVGQGSVRGFAMGFRDRPANARELAHQKRLVREAVAGGAVGLSTGLEYTPGSFADTAELVELARELVGTGYPFASHMRNEDDRVLSAVEETLHIGRMAGVPVQVSHLKAQGERNYWKADAALGIIEAARVEGLDAHFDRYPYVAYSTGLSNLFPAALRSGGSQGFLGRLRAADSRDQMEEAARAKVALLGSWDAVQIVSTNSASTRHMSGRKLGELSRETGKDPYELTLELLEAGGGSVSMIGFGMSEENTEKLLSHPLGMVCSDGGAFAPYGALSGGSPHPRAYGSFPRVLGFYVRDRRAMPLELAVHKMTAMPARKLRLEGRGELVPGAYADVVAFDPDTVADGATFEDPHQYPIGIPLVIVNGVVTLRDGEHTGSLGGRAVRGGGYPDADGTG